MKKQLHLMIRFFLLVIVMLGFVSFESNFAINNSNAQNNEQNLMEDQVNKGESVQNLKVSPNPFSERVRIQYTLLEEGKVKIRVYNILGNEVRTLEDRFMEKGEQDVFWDGNDAQNQSVSNGVYLIRIIHKGKIKTKKIVKTR